MQKIKNSINEFVRTIISPSTRYAIKRLKEWLIERIDLFKCWRWVSTELDCRSNHPFRVSYLGRKRNKDLAEVILGFKEHSEDIYQPSASYPKIKLSELPSLGAIRVPKYLRALVPLDKGVDQILAEYDSELRNKLKKNKHRFTMRQIHDEAEIYHAEHQLLRPFAEARHGDAVNHMPSETIRAFANQFGRLDLIYEDDKLVSCLLGMEYSINKKKYWIVDRFGYPEEVFANSKRFGDINSMNNHMAMEWAAANGYDYYDIGLVFARPWDGLLQWKKRRGSIMRTTALAGSSSFYLKVPEQLKPEFFWYSPVFSIENGELSLHLGLPAGKTEEDFLKHYSKMTFRELCTVYVYCAASPSQGLSTSLSHFYRFDDRVPKIKTLIAMMIYVVVLTGSKLQSLIELSPMIA